MVMDAGTRHQHRPHQVSAGCKPYRRKQSDYENNNYIYNGAPLPKSRIITPEWIICYTCVGLAALVCYLNNLGGALVHDDVRAIRSNPDVTGPRTVLSSIVQHDFWGKPMSAWDSHKSYRPLCVLSFRLNYILGGLEPWGYHVVNNGLHCVVSMLFTYICRRTVFVADPTSSLVAGLMFAVHPIHTEAVSGLVGRADLLACFFFQLSLISYLSTRSSKEWSPWSGGYVRSLVGTVMFAALALLSKENGITVLGVCIVYELYTFLNKYRAGCVKSNKAGFAVILNCAFRTTSCFIALACMVLFRLWMLGGRLPVFQDEDNPASFSPYLLTRMLTYSHLWSFNAWLILYPARLSHDWQMGSIPLIHDVWDTRNIASLVLLALMIRLGWSLVSQKKGSRVFLPMVLTILPYLPASHVILRVGFVLAERVLYIPSMGLIILIVQGMNLASRPNSTARWRNIKLSIVALLLLSSAFRTINRNNDWQSRESLARAGISVLPGNGKMHYNYANVLADRGETEKAIHHYRQAIRLWPNYASAHYNLATHLRDTATSLWHLNEVIRIHPCHTNALTSLAEIHSSSLGQTHKALLLLKKAATDCKTDNSPRPHLSLAALYHQQGYMALAETHYIMAVEIAPDRHDVHHNIGLFYESRGLNDAALKHLLKASWIDSQNPATFRSLARVYKTLGNDKKMTDCFKSALLLSRDPTTLEAVATYHFNRGDMAKSLDLFREAYTKSISKESVMHLAHALTSLQLYDEAEELLENHLNEFSSDVRLIVQLGSIYGLRNEHKQASDLLQKWAIGHYSSLDDKQKSTICHQIGNHLKDNYELEKSVLYFKEAVELDPANEDCHHNLAVYFHKKGLFDKAMRHYKAAISLDPKDNLLNINFNKFLQSTSLTKSDKIPNKTEDLSNDRQNFSMSSEDGKSLPVIFSNDVIIGANHVHLTQSLSNPP